MTNRSYWIAGIVILIFIVAYDFLFHGILLESYYSASPEVWRGQADSEFWCYLLSRIAFTALLLALYDGWKGAGTVAGGARLGVIVGAILGVLWAGEYAYLRIPMSLAWWWLFAFLIQGVVVGGLVGLLAKPKSMQNIAP